MRAEFEGQLRRDLGRMFRHGVPPAGDRALLDRFLVDGEEAAFEELVARHGPMVRGVCRRLLASPHDADDAFQATFLVLIRKAGGLRDADRLGPWLYGVAGRVAAKARSREARHRRRHEDRAEDPRARDGPGTDLLDVGSILDDELGRIAPKLRDVLVLCLLQGATAEEASRRLDCPVGTVKSRLARGREALRGRLAGRGVAPAVVFAAATSASAPPASASLIRATLATVAAAPAGVAPGVAALARGVAPAMIPKMTMMTSLCLGGIVLAGLGTATWLKPAALAQQPGGPEARQSPAPEGRLRDESKDHMKRVILAMHNYLSTNDHFPPSAIYGDDGQPKLSWRVALLPYLNQGDLHNEFRQDEPWDSPHNSALIARMPDVFRTPDSPAPEGQSRLRGFMGKGAMFDGVRGVRIDEVIDGTSNTLLIAASREPVVWTKPGELPFVAGQPLSALDDSNPAGCLVGMADGMARYIPPTNGSVLRHLITRSGNEVISWPNQAGATDASQLTVSSFQPTATPGPSPTPPRAGMAGMMSGGATATTPGMMPTATPPASSSVEQRLQRMEEKLDLLMQKLDSLPAAGAKP